MFPREVYHIANDKMYDLVDWDRARGYKLVDGTEVIHCKHTAFIPASNSDEDLLKATPKGDIAPEKDTAKPIRVAPDNTAEKVKQQIRDQMAQLKTIEEVAIYGEKHLGIFAKDLLEKYSHLPYSRFKMTIANRVRAVLVKRAV